MNRLEVDIQAQRQFRRTEDLEEVYTAALGPALQIEFAPQDLHHLQGLLASVRDLVFISPDLASTHRRRLLRRIDRLVVELGREIHDLSLFWGFVAEMSLAFRAPNEDAALLAPRMRELMQIVWSAQAKAFGRPPNTPPCDCWARTRDAHAIARWLRGSFGRTANIPRSPETGTLHSQCHGPAGVNGHPRRT